MFVHRSDSEEMNQNMSADEAEEKEKAPDLGDSDDETEVDCKSSSQPVTPTKVMPSRASKPKLGRFKEEPTPELVDEDA